MAHRPDHPRPRRGGRGVRRGGRDVRRRDRRAGAGGAPVQRAAAPLHGGPAGLDARASMRSGQRLATIEGSVPEPRCRASRLPLRRPLPVRRRALPRRTPRRSREVAPRTPVALLEGAARGRWWHERAAARLRERLVKHFVVRRSLIGRRRRRSCTPSTASRSASRPARRWRWSANRAAASPPSAASLLRLIEPSGGTRPLRRAGPRRALERRRCAARGRAAADDLPGPLQLAQPAHDGRRDAGRAAAAAHGPVARQPARARGRAAGAGRSEARARASAIRTSSRAASASASASPARSPSSRSSSSATSRCRRSTSPSEAQILNLLNDLQQRARARLPVHQPRPGRGEAHRRPRRRHVPRAHRRDARRARPSSPSRATPTPRRCSPAVPVPAARGRRAARGSCRATCRARSIRRPAATSIRAVRMRKTFARSRPGLTAMTMAHPVACHLWRDIVSSNSAGAHRRGRTSRQACNASSGAFDAKRAGLNETPSSRQLGVGSA